MMAIRIDMYREYLLQWHPQHKIGHYNTKQCLGGIINCLVLINFIHSLLDNLKFLHTSYTVFSLNIRSSLQIILCLSSHLLDKHIDFSWSLIDGFVSFIWWINGQMYGLISQKFHWEILLGLFDGYTENVQFTTKRYLLCIFKTQFKTVCPLPLTSHYDIFGCMCV